MSKEQIEEIDELTTVLYEANHKKSVLDYRWLATEAYNAGYRKQSEWISVDERLPQATGKYICGVKDKYGNTWTVSADWSLEMKTWFGVFGEIKNMVTHWMPLPEPPKMKGGAE